MLSVAQGITIAETDGVTAEPLLNTTGDAYSKLNYNEAATTAKESGDTDGPFALAAWARNESAGSEVIWVGCPNVDSEQVYQSIPGNLTFLQSCAAALVGQSMLIDTKALEAAPITVAASTSMALAMVFVFVLPATVLIAGAGFVLVLFMLPQRRHPAICIVFGAEFQRIDEYRGKNAACQGWAPCIIIF